MSRYNELVQNVTEAGESHSSQPDGINTTVPTVPRKHSLSVPQFTDVVIDDHPSPKKRYKYIKGGIDEEIERKRKVMIT